MSNKISIIIDNREVKLLDYFVKNNEKNNIQYTKKQLDIGDIHIINNKIDKTKNTDFKLPIVIERKTINDMLASIKDGRYKEQKTRLNGLLNQNEIKTWFYILEGNPSYLKETEKNTYNGVLISTQLRDNIQIINTQNCYETYEFIIKLVSRLEKKPIFKDNTSHTADITNTTYLNSIKLRKKDNITPEIVQMMAISNIPNCSFKISEAIINKYGTLMDLFDVYQGLEHESDKEILLSGIDISNNRKIGLKISKKIYEYLFKI